MKILVKDISPDGMQVSGKDDGSVMELGDDLVTGCHSLSYDLFVQEMDDELLVRGKIAADIGFSCVGCLKNFEKTIEERDFGVLLPIPDDSTAVDLTPEVRDAIILNFPSYPKCGDGCKGLCAQCGANLNEGACECQPEDVSPWGDLDKLEI